MNILTQSHGELTRSRILPLSAFLFPELFVEPFVMESYTEEQYRNQKAVNGYDDNCHCVTSVTCQSRQVTIFTIGFAIATCQ